MNFYINQKIQINNLRIDSVSNSSVLQIGSAGMIRSLSSLYNTGGFTGPAPEATEPLDPVTPLVPLTPPAPAAPTLL
ncbi:spore germination protein GerPB [Anaerobacillus sp. CMMVII]|uniref:spore germination protein GerPB n=1 Tax=Anaerobacillus sp. CMMVII TaxID=2755588 RepID=UPI0021B7FD51|nr:spore germination protein GerPB [Anaerobacillus sp. CMMVII]MCT8140362.1 spore germination protein GerPB [Anaerobacillus sp. CMMVII]